MTDMAGWTVDSHVLLTLEHSLPCAHSCDRASLASGGSHCYHIGCTQRAAASIKLSVPTGCPHGPVQPAAARSSQLSAAAERACCSNSQSLLQLITQMDGSYSFRSPSSRCSTAQQAGPWQWQPRMLGYSVDCSGSSAAGGSPASAPGVFSSSQDTPAWVGCKLVQLQSRKHQEAWTNSLMHMACCCTCCRCTSDAPLHRCTALLTAACCAAAQCCTAPIPGV